MVVILRREKMKNFENYLNGKKTFLGSLIEENSYLCFSIKKKNIIIEGNKEGFLTLAKYLIDYAYDTGEIYGNELALYPNISDEYIMDPLCSSSNSVSIKKINK